VSALLGLVSAYFAICIYRGRSIGGSCRLKHPDRGLFPAAAAHARFPMSRSAVFAAPKAMPGALGWVAKLQFLYPLAADK